MSVAPVRFLARGRARPPEQRNCHTSGMSEQRPTLVFDLDGTLVDSLPDILNSFLHAFDTRGLARPEQAAARALVGRPLDEMYGAFAPAAEVAPLSAAYRQHYPQHFTDHTRPHDGVVELLTWLAEHGYLRVVATTKRSGMARALVDAVGLAPYLDHVQGTDAFPHKPAPDVVLRALEAVDGRGLWMVGDTVSDILAGKAAGLATYAVGWGTQTLAELKSAEPDALEMDLVRLKQLL